MNLAHMHLSKKKKILNILFCIAFNQVKWLYILFILKKLLIGTVNMDFTQIFVQTYKYGGKKGLQEIQHMSFPKQTNYTCLYGISDLT